MAAIGKSPGDWLPPPALTLPCSLLWRKSSILGLQLFIRPVPNLSPPVSVGTKSLTLNSQGAPVQPDDKQTDDGEEHLQLMRPTFSPEGWKGPWRSFQWQRVVSSQKPSCGPHLVGSLDSPFCTSPWPAWCSGLSWSSKP